MKLEINMNEPSRTTDPDFPLELRSLPGAQTGCAQFTFTHAEGFRPLVYNFNCPNFGDWDEHLKTCGWEHVATLPEHESDFRSFSLCIWRQGNKERDWAGCYLIELMTQSATEADIICANILDVIEVFQNHFSLLQLVSDVEKIAERIDRFEEIFCDPDVGLPAAQRFRDRERRWAAERKMREAERKRKAKSAATAPSQPDTGFKREIE